MSWVKIDDNFPDHPKLWKMGKRRENAMAVVIAVACWCSRNLTDGRIPKSVCHTITSSARKTSQMMVEVGLLIDDGDSYLLKDYLDYNPSREQVLASRARNRERQERHRNAVTNGVSNTAPTPTPIKHSIETPRKTAKKKGEYTPDFDRFWDIYPRTTGKAAAFRAWNARLNSGSTADEMIAGASRYAAYCKREDVEQRYMKMPSTFLGPDEWFTEKWEAKKEAVEW